MTRATGFLHDSDERLGAYPRHHELLAAGDALLSEPYHVPFRAGRVYQGTVSQCVGSSLKRCVQLWQAVRGERGAPISDLAAYAIGRAQANRGYTPELAPPLLDVGSRPADVLTGARAVGLVLEADWPGAASDGWPSDPSDVDARVAEQPGPDQLASAYDARGLEFAIVDTGNGWEEAVDDCLRSGFSIMAPINSTGIAKQDPGFSVVQSLPSTGHDHMITILGRERSSDPYVVDNWWDDPSGPFGAQTSDATLQGTWRATAAALRSGCAYLYAVRGVPPMVRP